MRREKEVTKWKERCITKEGETFQDGRTGFQRGMKVIMGVMVVGGVIYFIKCIPGRREKC